MMVVMMMMIMMIMMIMMVMSLALIKTMLYFEGGCLPMS